MPVSASLWAASAAVRIASLDLCSDEYLLMLGRPDQIASVSRVSQDAEDSLMWRKAKRFPANDGSLETTLAARPTVVITMGGGGRSTSLIATRMGMRVVQLPYPSSITDVARNMGKVAALTGNANSLKAWQGQLAQLERGPSRPVDAAFLGQGGLSVGPSSLPAQWMALAGYRQIALPSQRLTLERLAVAPPPVLLRSTYRVGQQSRGQQWLDHPLVRQTRAKTVVTDGRPWTCGGPLMVGEIARLRGLK